MIRDSVKHSDLYANLSDNISQALGYLKTVDAANFEAETVEISGKDVFAMHQLYTTVSDEGRLYESHRSYIDVQFVLEGTEIIRVADMRGLSATMEYDSEKDVILYDLADGTDVKLESGDFVILYPHDAHVPTLQSGSPADVKKIVLKVRV